MQGSYSFRQSFVYFWKNSLRLTGRANRAQFWWNQLWYYAVLATYALIVDELPMNEALYMLGSFMAVFIVVTTLPRWTLAIRRYRDIGFSNRVLVLYVIFVITVNICAYYGEGWVERFGMLLENITALIMLGVVTLPTDYFIDHTHR